ncbi:MAG: helix-turn-helix domain-containing protein [Patescibacteria group bacterium]
MNTSTHDSAQTIIFPQVLPSKSQDIFVEAELILPFDALAGLRNSFQIVKKAVAYTFDVPLSTFRMRSRGNQKLSNARMIAIFICYKWKLGSMHCVGDEFDRDHGCVVHAECTIPLLLEMSKEHQEKFLLTLKKIAEQTIVDRMNGQSRVHTD